MEGEKNFSFFVLRRRRGWVFLQPLFAVSDFDGVKVACDGKVEFAKFSDVVRGQYDFHVSIVGQVQVWVVSVFLRDFRSLVEEFDSCHEVDSRE